VSASVDITIEAGDWHKIPGAEAAVRRAVDKALADAGPSACEISILLSDDASIRTLNRTWRGKDTATNVLSFPAADPDQDGPRLLGDVVLAFETIAREAAAEGKPVEDHLSHLAVHGVLHLLGFDHERDEDAEAMEARERTILARLGISDPYAAPMKRTEPA
jgi:probable rRNA maturation factor